MLPIRQSTAATRLRARPPPGAPPRTTCTRSACTRRTAGADPGAPARGRHGAWTAPDRAGARSTLHAATAGGVPAQGPPAQDRRASLHADRRTVGRR